MRHCSCNIGDPSGGFRVYRTNLWTRGSVHCRERRPIYSFKWHLWWWIMNLFGNWPHMARVWSVNKANLGSQIIWVIYVSLSAVIIKMRMCLHINCPRPQHGYYHCNNVVLIPVLKSLIYLSWHYSEWFAHSSLSYLCFHSSLRRISTAE